MSVEIRAVFDETDNGIQAVDYLLNHSVRAEDIELTLPIPHSNGRVQAISRGRPMRSTERPRFHDLETPDLGDGSKPVRHADPDTGIRRGPLPRLRQDANRYRIHEHPMWASACRERGAPWGQAFSDAFRSVVLKTRANWRGETVVDAKQGAGLGLGIGMVAAMCIPDIDLLAALGTFVAGLAVTCAVAGGIAGGIYGFLIDRRFARKSVGITGDHPGQPLAILSVIVSVAGKEARIAGMIEEFGGRLVPSST